MLHFTVTSESESVFATSMKLSSAFSLLDHLWLAIQVALPPTILALWHGPSLMLSPSRISRLFMAHVWRTFGDFCDEGGRLMKEKLIPSNAYGVVLDLGAGQPSGHVIPFIYLTYGAT